MKSKVPCFLIFLLFFSLSALSQKNANPRAEWFTHDRFGMFIHWGVYSGAEGIWKGEKIRYDNDYAEWIYYRNRIDKAEYVKILEDFDWESIRPEEWVLLAKQAGMKYVTITAKHHDGFALWDSESSDYDIAEYTSPKRDIIRELADACRKHGLKLGLYYSHWVDWEHPYGWDHSKEIYPISNEDYDIYWQKKVMPQMRELLTNYGDIGLIWFDMWIHHSESIVSKEQLLQLKNLIRELQPDCLVNSRLGLSIEEDQDVDFKTLGDNQLGDKKEDFPWQSPATVAHSWGYHALDTEWKSTSFLLKALISNASLNGNFMLNIGPRADGSVPREIEQRLHEMGEWLAVNGESVYGTQAFDLPASQNDWGKITMRERKDGSCILYLHLFNRPLSGKICMTGVTEAPVKAYSLADKSQSAIDFTFNKVITSLDISKTARESYVQVIALVYDKKPNIVEDLCARSLYGGYSLLPENAIERPEPFKMEKSKRFGSVPNHIKVNKLCRLKWRVFIDGPKTLTADVSYNFQGSGTDSKIYLSAAGAWIEHQIMPTGKYVGEPNTNWHIDVFKSNRLGEIKFPAPGYYNILIEFDPEEGQEFDFQWLWLQDVD